MSNKIKKTHEPLFHIAKRDSIPSWKAWLIRVAAIIFALIVCGLLTMFLTGENPISVYASMIDGAIGTERRIWRLLQDLAILLCISLAVTPAFKMKFWNIGAEGQVLIGGLATAACSMFLSNSLPPYLLIPVMFIASMVAGAIWAVIPAFFKAHWNTNETLFTLMMNYIAIQFVSYFCFIYSVPKGSGKIPLLPKVSWLPTFGDNDYLVNIIIVAIITFGMYIYLKYNKHGYEISVVGESENTAKYIGLKDKIGAASLSGVDLFQLFQNLIKLKSAQTRAFLFLEALWKSSAEFSVETTWKRYDNMVITSLQPVRDNNADITDFTVTFKQIRKTASLSKRIDVAGRVNEQMAKQDDKGVDKGKQTETIK